MIILRGTLITVCFILTNYTCQCLFPNFFSLDELRHAREPPNEQNLTVEECNDDVFINYLAELQIASPENIINLSLLDGQTLCSKLLDVLKGVDKYLVGCRAGHNLYLRLLNGVKVLNKLLCFDTDFFNKFDMYYNCLRELEKDFEVCSGPLDWNEEPSNKKVCKTYKKISDCYFVKIAEVCGVKGARLMKSMITAIINEVITSTCDNIKTDPFVQNPMPDMYIRKSQDEAEMGSSGNIRNYNKTTILCIFAVYFIRFLYNSFI